MKVGFGWEVYQRPFRIPLQTHHGSWTTRTGILITLHHPNGSIGRGEIAPLPWFGSETLEESIALLHEFPPSLSASEIFSIPNTMPATQFGLGSAWADCMHRSSAIPGSLENLGGTDFQPHPSSCLLPTGETALTAWQDLWSRGYRTFKWKIAVAPLEVELHWFRKLCQRLPDDVQLRLDANGGLRVEAAKTWLDWCDRTPRVEYLEQPLPPEQFEQMQQLSQDFQTTLALDESVVTLSQLRDCAAQGWQGVMVIKPAIVGYPQQLHQFLKTHTIDAVFSSVFETRIGRKAALEFAKSFQNPNRATGFGVNHWFSENE
jgi:O-succinylbenzoate synthase